MNALSREQVPLTDAGEAYLPGAGANGCCVRPQRLYACTTMQKGIVALLTTSGPDTIALAPALTTVSTDESPGFYVALAFHVDQPHWLCDEVVAQQLPGRTGDLNLV
jgi:hypothetical protein